MQLTFLRPMDQFLGTDRLIERFRNWLQDQSVSHIRFAAAFAKSGPLLRLGSLIDQSRKRGKNIEAVFGVDHLGTSRQALEFALRRLDRTYITHTPANSTFHPKFYLAYGDRHATIICGSHNLTVGGTETNLEAGIEVSFVRPEEENDFQQALGMWDSLLPESCVLTQRLDAALLADLLRDALVCDETIVAAQGAGRQAAAPRALGRFALVSPRPASAIPAGAFLRTPTRQTGRGRGHQPVPIAATLGVRALVIQVVPHHNGEVFLSKLAVNQNPGFFGFPFTGRTVPKKRSNIAYPQRVPDPLVNITIYDSRGGLVFSRQAYALNTVYYEAKAEIRITLSPDIVRHIPQYSVLIMRPAAATNDYDMEIYAPGSTMYQQYLNVCNQTMPSGGAAQARRMGWL